MAKTGRIPEGFHSVTPYLIVRGAARAIEFYKKAFGAEELVRNYAPDGKAIMHARVKIGDSIMLLNDEFPEGGGGMSSPAALGGCTSMLHLYVEDPDAVFKRAVAGAKARMEMQDAFWGDRYGQIEDPFGHIWSIACQLEKLKPAEIRERAAEAFKE